MCRDGSKVVVGSKKEEEEEVRVSAGVERENLNAVVNRCTM